MRIVVHGQQAFGKAVLEALLKRGENVIAVYVAPEKEGAKADPLKGILHQSPRLFGKARSTWTLDLLADVAFEQGLTPRRLSHEAVRQAVKRLGHGWKRAKQWITSPDPAYARKKKRGTG